MTDLCGPLLTELSIGILTESGLPIYTECFVADETPPTEEESSGNSTRRGRFRKIVGRRHGAPIFIIVRTLTEDNF